MNTYLLQKLLYHMVQNTYRQLTKLISILHDIILHIVESICDVTVLDIEAVPHHSIVEKIRVTRIHDPSVAGNRSPCSSLSLPIVNYQISIRKIISHSVHPLIF